MIANWAANLDCEMSRRFLLVNRDESIFRFEQARRGKYLADAAGKKTHAGKKKKRASGVAARIT